MNVATRKKGAERYVTYAVFATTMEQLHAKMDAGFAEVGRRFDRVDGEIRVMKQDIGEIRGDIAEIRSDVTVLKQDVAVLKQDVAGLKGDMARVKDASMQHTRELSALRNEVATKVDRVDVESEVERALARRE